MQELTDEQIANLKPEQKIFLVDRKYTITPITIIEVNKNEVTIQKKDQTYYWFYSFAFVKRNIVLSQEEARERILEMINTEIESLQTIKKNYL